MVMQKPRRNAGSFWTVLVTLHAISTLLLCRGRAIWVVMVSIGEINLLSWMAIATFLTGCAAARLVAAPDAQFTLPVSHS